MELPQSCAKSLTWSQVHYEAWNRKLELEQNWGVSVWLAGPCMFPDGPFWSTAKSIYYHSSIEKKLRMLNFKRPHVNSGSQNIHSDHMFIDEMWGDGAEGFAEVCKAGVYVSLMGGCFGGKFFTCRSLKLELIFPWTKWPLFHRWHFQMHFHEWKVLYFD